MTKRMLIDSTHAEETRVVVLDDSKLEDFDVETSTKKQLKGNIYLAKIVRVEPSLQAAFVEYGGGRHGFLAFGEIHPDYYQIPVADRQRLLAIQAEEARVAEAEEDAAALGEPPPAVMADAAPAAAVAAEAQVEPAAASDTVPVEASAPEEQPEEQPEPQPPEQPASIPREEVFAPPGTVPEPDPPGGDVAAAEPVTETGEEPADTAFVGGGAADVPDGGAAPEAAETEIEEVDEQPPPETVGGDDSTGDGAEDARTRRASRLLRSYRIQEVIHRRQIILVQVVKEERGSKGAALTTYISLAGRFSVLMPNSPRGGGVSRKITSAADRKRLKEVTAELDLPSGMGLIVRTAGANRPKPEIRRDCEYLMRLWDDIREHTLRSVAPALIYEEASLIKRAIRDVYSRDIDEIMVDGEEGFRAAHEFMRMLMPSHARKVQLWRGADGMASGQGGQPLFAKYQVEAQLDAMLSPTVQLKSGGYLVIDQTEALVAIDVNSGRSTRERNVEETAVRTNLEAADEAARQLRLRDLAGLIVIDFIDMESRRHNAAVEKRLKDALKVDRARIQVGPISHFGLLEMSRQRLRPSLAETSFDPCPHCGGTGHVRNVDSSAISVLRAIEDEGAKAKASAIMVHAASTAMMYLLNHKRDRLGEIESRFGMRVQFAADDMLTQGQVRIDRLRPMGEVPPVRPAGLVPVVPVAPAYALPAGVDGDAFDDDDIEIEDQDAPSAIAADAAAGMTAEDSERRRKRRRRRRGSRREGGPGEAEAGQAPEPGDLPDAALEAVAAGDAAEPALPVDLSAAAEAGDIAATPSGDEQPSVNASDLDEDGLPRARRRGRRGGRRRRGGAEDETDQKAAAVSGAEESYVPAPYTGPTPADPFGGGAFDIFDMIDMAAEAAPATSEPMPAVAHQPAPELEPEPENVAAEFSPPLAHDAPEHDAPEHDGPEHDGPEHDGPEHDGPEHDGPEHDGPEHDGPEHDGPEHDGPEHDGPEHDGPEHDGPEHDGPEHDGPEHDGPEHDGPHANGAVVVAEVPDPGPRIQPVVIGAGEPAAERKRGWWRR